ncbi:hypothetical protein GCM10010430_40600 [Kitasatospora cystarginea]|uniref:Uncharacterized protein n=1 Tax=Kitasatospora cystarginea TaxID=58350 RepID=A0ABP5R6E3_9ACTN
MTLILTLDPDLTPGLQDGIVGLWAGVSDAGGAVGFVPPVTEDRVWRSPRVTTATTSPCGSTGVTGPGPAPARGGPGGRDVRHASLEDRRAARRPVRPAAPLQ